MRIKLQVNYTAYGLKIAGISSKKLPDVNEGNIKNNNLYNDKELIDEADLGWYDYGFRNYDPQIGRFPQLDPLTWDYPELTNYQYASCEPIANIDIDGLEAGSAVATGVQRMQTLSTVVVSAAKTAAPTTLRVVGKTAKVIAMKAATNSSVWGKIGLGLLNVGSKLAGTFGWLLTPMDAGVRPSGNAPPGMHWGGDYYVFDNPVTNPVGVPNTQPKPKPKDDADNQKTITLYRGVHKKHPGFKEAKKGIATPRGGISDKDSHNGGNSFTIYTSWTMAKGVAQHHANKSGIGGIILIKKFKLSEITPSPDEFSELEVLIKGRVTGAKTEMAKPGGTRSVF